MQATPLLPWLPATLELAEIRRGDRVMQLTSHDASIARAIVELCGPRGTVVVLEPDRELAERVAAAGSETLHVVAIAPDGTEKLGRFDALVGCAVWNPGWPLETWGAAIRGNLRPGGRFAVDLPAETACETVEAAWRDAFGPADERAARWQGASEAEVAEALRGAGLRNVEGVVGTHLARFDSPRALAELWFAAIAHDDGDVETLSVALASRLATIGEIEVVFRRTRISGIR